MTVSPSKSPAEVLELANAAAVAESMKVWERDGKTDRGCCGGYVMILDSRMKFSKVAVELGFAYGGSEIYAKFKRPEEIQSQHMDIEVYGMMAFKKVIVDNGYGKAIKRSWSYVD